MANEGIEVLVYKHDDPQELITPIVNREEPQSLDQVNGVGGGSFTINVNDPIFNDYPTVLAYRNLVRVLDDGLVVGAFLINQSNSEIISDGEASKEVYKVNGEGPLTWLNDAEVKPLGGVKKNSPENRYFSFASEVGDWYNASDWSAPYVVGTVHAVPWWGERPTDWPDKSTAKWLWGQSYTNSAPLGICYFRHTFTISTEGTYVIYVSGDDYLDVYLDGGQVVTDNRNGGSYGTTTKLEVTLTAGTHYLGMRCENTGGPAGVLEAIYLKGTDDSETLVTSSSNTGEWKVLAYPTAAPGWTPGEIMLTLFDEAAARGILFPTYLTPTFSSTLDSNGQAWSSTEDWSFTIGDSLLSVLNRICEMGYEAWVSPDTLEFNLASVRGTNRTEDPNAVVFAKGKNITKANSAGVGKIKNSLLLKTAEGWLEVQDEDSVNLYGVIEGTLTADVSNAVATKLADAVFSQRATPEEGASYELHPTPDERPWRKVFTGDWVLAPNDRLLKVPRRIMSLSIAESDSGKARYTAEFDTIFQSNEQRLNKALNKTSGGGLGSGYSSAVGNPSVGSPIQVTPGGPPVKYPKAPTGLSATSSGRWSVDGVTPLSDVHLTWNAVTENTDETELIPSGYIVEAKQIGATGWLSYGQVTNNELDLLGLPVQTDWAFRVRTVGNNSTSSVFTVEYQITTEGPTDPLSPPDTPTLTSSLGLLTVVWNGLLNGVVPPPQFRYIYAEVAPDVSGSPGTFVPMGPSLSRDGRNIVISDLTVGDSYWVHLIAVDGMGIASAASNDVMQEIIGVDLGDLGEDVTEAIDAAHQAAIDARSTINLLEDPSFELNTEEFWDWNNANVSNVTTAPRTGSRHLQLNATGSSYEALRYKKVLEADPGDSFLFRLYYRNASGDPVDSQDEGIELIIYSGATEGSLTTETLVTFTPELQETGYQLIEGTWLVPDGEYFFVPVLNINDTTTTNIYYVDDIRVLRMTGVSLLVDGAVIADKIGAGEVIAGKLAAGAVAAENIQASSITAEHLSAESVTAQAIKSGEIESDHIKAGAIQVTHLSPSVGTDINIAGNVVIQSINESVGNVADNLDDTNDNLAEMQTYYSFGASGAIISTPGSPFETAIRSDRIEMLENGNVISYWNSGQLVVNQLVAEQLKMGTHQVQSRVGGTIVRYVG